MNVIKTQQKIAALLEFSGRGQNRTLTIDHMVMIMLIYRDVATSNNEVANKMKKPQSSIRKMAYQLSDGKGASLLSGYGFIQLVPVKQETWNDPRLIFQLTKEGKKCGRILARAFGD